MRTYYPTIRVKLDEGAMLPDRAHETDAGADIFAPHDVTVPARGSAVIDTGVHVETPDCCDSEIWSKSGLNINDDIVTTGLVDEGYTGSVVVKLYNLGDKDKTFKKGDKIAQLVVRPVCYPDFVHASEIHGKTRGTSGFGSTGR